MYAIQKCEHWQVVGFNRDGTQQRLYSSHTLRHLLQGYAKLVAQREALGAHNNTLSTYKVIKVWNIEQGFTGLDLPYIPQVSV